MARTKVKNAKRGRPPKAKEPRKRQKHLPGLEPETIPAIDKAADRYLDAREDRFQIIKTFADAKLNLVAAMRENKLTHYEYDGHVVDLDESIGVKVKNKKDTEGDGDDAED